MYHYKAYNHLAITKLKAHNHLVTTKLHNHLAIWVCFHLDVQSSQKYNPFDTTNCTEDF